MQTVLDVTPINGVNSLYWQADYVSPQNATTQITFSFNRPVNNFSLRIQDIDIGANAWIDKVTFAATQANGVVLNLSSATDATVTRDPAYVSLSGNSLTGLQAVAPNSALGNATVTFSKPIVSFQITYQNTLNIPDPIQQYIAIDYMSWCTQANVATTLSGPARAVVGTQVTYTATTTASGDYDASGVKPRVQLSPGLNSQSPVFPAGSSYNNVTGVLTLQVVPLLAVGTSSTSIIRFNMPASTVTGVASSTIDTDDADPIDNNGSLAAAKVTTSTNAAPTAAAKSANVTRNTAVFSALPAMTGTDPNGDVLTYTIVGSSIANINFGTVYYTRGGALTALAGTSDVTLTAAEAATLEYKNTNGVIGASRTFSYFVSDPYGGVSPAVNYTITIGDQPAVYTMPNVAYSDGTGRRDEVIATIADSDGAISGATIATGTLPTNLLFNTTTGAFSRDNQKNIAVGTYSFTVNTTGIASGATTAVPVTIRIISTDTEAVYSTGNTYNRDALNTGSSLATVTDADGGVTAATLTGTPATGIAFNTTTGQFTVNSVTVPFAGTYIYSVNTTDAANGTTATTATITIRDDVEAAYTSAAAQPGAYANGYSLATVTDADGSITNATLSTSTLPAGVGLNTTTGQFTVIDRTLLRPGTYIVQVITTDATGGRTLQDVAINIGTRPLPVELTAFTATAVKNVDTQLAWNTASEKNNDHFSVARSLNGTDFVQIAQVKGQGSKSAPTDYALTDAGIGAKASGTVYYRLQQVDADGTATYSPVRTVAFTKALLAPAITLFSNPATATTKLDLTQLPTGSYQVSLLDVTGRVVLRSTLSAGLTHGLNLNSLANGTYTVLVRGQNGSEVISLTKRLIKE